MAEAKTKATNSSVEAYIDSRANPAQRSDCEALMEIFGRVTEEAPKMWGPSIVGYGSYRYPLSGGRTGESCVTGFAIRGREIVVYILLEDPDQEVLLARLGKYRNGKVCLYFKRLDDLDRGVLEQLIQRSVETVRHRYETG